MARHSVGTEKFVAAAILTVIGAMSVGLLAYAWSTRTVMSYSDERQYFDIARGIVAGKGYSFGDVPTAYRPPVWPGVIAIFLWLRLPVELIALIPATFMIAAAFSAAYLGLKISRSNWGLLAGIAILAYPLNVYTSVKVYPQSLATFLLLLIGIALYWSSEGQSQGRGCSLHYLLVGFAAAMLSLSVPVLAFTGCCAIIWLTICAGGDRRRAAGMSLAAFAVPVLIWTIRNIKVMGEPIFLSTSSGQNLWLGNNPGATASSGVAVDMTEVLHHVSSMNEVDRDAAIKASALQWITHHPADAVFLYVAKVLNYFAPYNEPVTAAEGSVAKEIVAYASFTMMIGLLAARVLLRKRSPLLPIETFFIGTFFINSLVMGIFFTRARFRQPLDNYLLVEGGVAIAILIVTFLRRRTRTDP